MKISIFTGGIAQTNGYLISIGDRHLIVDAPEGMENFVKKSKLKPEALLLTHQHFDHCQDAAALKAEYDLPIYAFEDFSRDLTLEFLMGFSRGTRFEVSEFKVDHLLKEKKEIEVAGQKVQLAYVPGHSLDSITFYFPNSTAIFSGDVLFEGSVGRTDFPGGSMPRLLSGIKEHLYALPDNVVVYPGHGDKTSIGQEKLHNPYVTA